MRRDKKPIFAKAERNMARLYAADLAAVRQIGRPELSGLPAKDLKDIGT
jgi:hypothetical protein